MKIWKAAHQLLPPSSLLDINFGRAAASSSGGSSGARRCARGRAAAAARPGPVRRHCRPGAALWPGNDTTGAADRNRAASHPITTAAGAGARPNVAHTRTPSSVSHTHRPGYRGQTSTYHVHLTHTHTPARMQRTHVNLSRRRMNIHTLCTRTCHTRTARTHTAEQQQLITDSVINKIQRTNVSRIVSQTECRGPRQLSQIVSQTEYRGPRQPSRIVAKTEYRTTSTITDRVTNRIQRTT